MKLKVGDVFEIETKTKDNIFGKVIWTIQRVGLKIRVSPGEYANDGVKCVLVKGTGPAARPGFVVFDRESIILGNIEKGIAKILDKTSPAARQPAARKGGNGVIEG